MYAHDAQNDSIIVEVKTKLSAIRSLRDALVQLAKLLVEFKKKKAYLHLINPQISMARLEKELKDFKAAMRSDISTRLHIVTEQDGEIKKIPPDITNEELSFIRQKIDASSGLQTILSQPDLQSEVFRVLLHQWIKRKGPMTSDWLAKTVGCSYRTVAATIKKLGRSVERLSDRRVQLKHFPNEEWRQFLAIAQKARATIRYSDRSDQPRSPESNMRRLQRFGRTDTAIGGVIGAKQHYSELDIVGTPRLDLIIHAPGKQVDISFVQQLDPALKQISDPYVPSSLALHFIRRKKSFFVRDSEFTWADPIECLVDLYDARLELQASEFEAFISSQ